MTNEWYEADEYWYKSMDDGYKEPDLEKIVAEAMRMGEMKAWEEARALLAGFQSGCSEIFANAARSGKSKDVVDMGAKLDVLKEIIEVADEQLTELKK